jgi:endonuclease YncB( thermonuclease family)
LLLLALSSPIQAATTYGSILVDRVGTVIDGDSFKVDINSWPSIVGKSITVRVNGIDTPEMRGKCAYEKQLARKAKQYAVNSLRSGKKVRLANIKRGKYFRIIADVYIDGQSLSESLLSARLAKKYSGGKRKSWCK